MLCKRLLGIQHNRAVRPAPENSPMPERPTHLQMPLGGEKGKRGQRFPRLKRRLIGRSVKTEVPQKHADMMRFRPEALIFRENAEAVCHGLCLFVGDTGECGDARDAAACDFLLNDWIHETPSAEWRALLARPLQRFVGRVYDVKRHARRETLFRNIQCDT